VPFASAQNGSRGRLAVVHKNGFSLFSSLSVLALDALVLLSLSLSRSLSLFRSRSRSLVLPAIAVHWKWKFGTINSNGAYMLGDLLLGSLLASTRLASWRNPFLSRLNSMVTLVVLFIGCVPSLRRHATTATMHARSSSRDSSLLSFSLSLSLCFSFSILSALKSTSSSS